MLDSLWLWPRREDGLIDVDERQPARFKEQGASPHSILQSGKCTRPVPIQLKMQTAGCWLICLIVQKLIHLSLLRMEIRNKAYKTPQKRISQKYKRRITGCKSSKCAYTRVAGSQSPSPQVHNPLFEWAKQTRSLARGSGRTST